MGKKNKRSMASTSEPSSKKPKMSGQPPEPEPEPLPSIMVDYEKMPLSHKKKFYINDDCGSMYKYIGVIAWLRSMGCFSGTGFEGIGNLNWVVGEGYPCVEIEVVNPDNKSAKFIISKSDLYLIAFYSHKWFQFPECAFKFTGAGGRAFTLLDKEFTGAYIGNPWTHIGPKNMIDAVDFLATELPNGNMTNFVRSCEVFYVHLCEAARLYPVESLICKTLAPPLTPGIFDKPTYEDEEKLLLSAPGDANISVDDDVYSLVKAHGPINLKTTNATPSHIQDLIKKFSNLSKFWYLYSLTDKKFYEIKDHDVSRFHLRSIKSLRCTLAVLCNTNLDKLLMQWKKKASAHPIITPDVYKQMEDRVRELQGQAKVFVPKDSSRA